jgi:hypothetical protein
MRCSPGGAIAALRCAPGHGGSGLGVEVLAYVGIAFIPTPAPYLSSTLTTESRMHCPAPAWPAGRGSVRPGPALPLAPAAPLPQLAYPLHARPLLLPQLDRSTSAIRSPHPLLLSSEPKTHLPALVAPGLSPQGAPTSMAVLLGPPETGFAEADVREESRGAAWGAAP